MDTIAFLIVAWLIRQLTGGSSPIPPVPPVPPPFPPPAPIPIPVPPVPTPIPVGPATYTIRSGDTGVSLARRFTGDADRWKEILSSNPGLKAVTVPSPKTGVPTTLIVPWKIGQVIKLPSGWNPARTV